MNRKRLFTALVFVITILSAEYGSAGVDWKIQDLLKLEEPPLDMAFDLSGRWIYVLSSEGKLNIYNSKGQLQDTIDVGKHIDGIEVGPWENKLFLKSRDNSAVQVLSLSFRQKINIIGSPFKGPSDAPVVMVAFDDFQ